MGISDDPIWRMANFMMHHMRRGCSPAEAMDRAWAHEPQLTADDMRLAADYCRCHMMACEIATAHAQSIYVEYCAAIDCGGAVPDRPSPTIDDVLRQAGIDPEG